MSKLRTLTSRISTPARRGNALIMVAAMLVLLVTIATAYVGRTQTLRVTAKGMQDANLFDNKANVVADMLSGMIAEHLFLRPIDLVAAGPGNDDSNIPRRPIEDDARRYENDDEPASEFNMAPFAVYPITNWPPPNSLFIGFQPPPDDPPGYPGTNDHRWLRSNEPDRLVFNDPDGIPGSGDEEVAYINWPHLSCLARAENGWRIVTDISNVFGDALPGPPPILTGGVITNLRVPFEQWMRLTRRPTSTGTFTPDDFAFEPMDAASGELDLESPRAGINAFPDSINDFLTSWQDWFSNYGNVYWQDGLPPANYYRLADLDADGIVFNYPSAGPPQDTPEAEFNRGTRRWHLSRILTDTDGDGYTDAFWHLAPTQTERGIRQLVAVSIIDNSAMINVNAGTTFVSANEPPNPGLAPAATAGHTPADIALVSDYNPILRNTIASGTFETLNLGFYDNRLNQFTGDLDFGFVDQSADDYSIVYHPDLWNRHVNAVNLYNQSGQFRASPDQFDRLEYNLRSLQGRTIGLDRIEHTPFTLDDELELRMFSGNNYPWVLSGYELTTQSDADASADSTDTSDSDPSLAYSFLRAGTPRKESTDYFNRMRNVYDPASSVFYSEAVADSRKRITTYNATRNDLMPPYLWPNGNDTEVTRRRRLDLRVPLVSSAGLPTMSEIEFLTAINRRLQAAMIVSDGNGYVYDGVTDGEASEINNEMVAALTANIQAWRDRDDDPLPWNRRVGIENVDGDLDETISEGTEGFLGMEKQPFLVEAFIAQVYRQVEQVPDTVCNYPGEGQNVITGDSPKRIVIAVQIANPYTKSKFRNDGTDGTTTDSDWIDLAQYKLRVFGREFQFPFGARLGPSTEDQPRTATVFACDTQCDTVAAPDTLFRNKWNDFLDLEDSVTFGTFGALNADTLLFNGNDAWLDPDGDGILEHDLDTLMGSSEQPIELIRRLPLGGGEYIVVDRIDIQGDGADPGNELKTALDQLTENALYEIPDRDEFCDPDFDVVSPGDPSYFTGVRIGDNDYFAQWIRVGRIWGYDWDPNSPPTDPADVNTAQLAANERAPRFIFAHRPDPSIVRSTYTAQLDDGSTTNIRGDAFEEDQEPDGDASNAAWFEETYRSPVIHATTTQRTRKPTFFNVATVWDGLQPVYDFDFATAYNGVPDKGALTLNDYFYTGALQMLHKDADFEQVGELMNVWAWGHRISDTITGSPTVSPTYDTVKTFSEYLSDPSKVFFNAAGDHYVAGGDEYDDPDEFVKRMRRIHIGRLLPRPIALNSAGDEVANAILGEWFDSDLDGSLDTPLDPLLPATVRVLESFVCDGPGVQPFDINGNTTIEPIEEQLSQFGNAGGFRDIDNDGYADVGTPGLINASTASVEVMRALPHMSELYKFLGVGSQLAVRTRLPEAIVQYRDLKDGGANFAKPSYVFPDSGGTQPSGLITDRMLTLEEAITGDTGLPTPTIATWHLDGLRQDRGLASPHETLMMVAIPTNPMSPTVDDRIVRKSWGVNFAGEKPYANDVLVGTADPVEDVSISTDVQPEFSTVTQQFAADGVAEDAEEANLLHAGISNLLTTRSDTFTVYFRIRSFRRDQESGIWDATDPENIVDDSRYVMLVDRSNVNKPTDKPKVLYLEKLPN